ncbi:MAG TPA: NAD(P)H-hydrate dehydratase [Beijerinckiaceae bacterium]
MRGSRGAIAAPGNEILTSAEMGQADALAVTGGVSLTELIRRAGTAVADAARAMAPAGPILVLCGPGNNGADGYVAASLLAQAGREVSVALMPGLPAPAGAAEQAAAAWSGPTIDAQRADPAAYALVIDALFGSGLKRDLSPAVGAILERWAAAGTPVLAVDVPTGLDADTGQVRGGVLPATRTVTFVRRKPGHLLLPGRELCGHLDVLDIGIGAELVASLSTVLWHNGPALWRTQFPVPATAGHKYSRGHALVLSGPAWRTGAARLAALGALRIGAGLVTLASPSEALSENAAHLTAVMLRPCEDAGDLRAILSDRRFNAVALGPGLGVGPATEERVAAALDAGVATVLDADALTSFASRPERLAALCRGTASWPVVTPHEGEFARLFAAAPETASKVERARRAAAILGAVVILKGPDTVIAAPDGRAAINDNGSPYLATAGSGDVLAGFVTGLLAQGMPPFEAACAGTWLHGAAGRLGGPGLIAEDLPGLLPKALAALLDAIR